nr:sulfurtransferase [Streptomyces sp. SID8377]
MRQDGPVDTIISAQELAADLHQGAAPVILDVRYERGGPSGREAYEAGHIAGAVYVDLEADLAGPPGPAGRHPLPDTTVFEDAMRRAGVRRDSRVVVHDGGQGWAAARAWWILRWAGHGEVRVLDGGLPAWTATGGELTTRGAAPEPGDFEAAPDSLPVLSADDAAALARTGVLLDARAAERYRGEVEPLDPVGGHIPGAVSAPTAGNVTADGTFRPTRELARRFAALGVTEGGGRVGVYCGSGVSAAQQVLALAVAGIDAALYVGSWSEWSADPARPVATGPLPG